MTPHKKSALLAFVIASALISTLPAASAGKDPLGGVRNVLPDLGGAIDQTLSGTDAALREAREKAEAALRRTRRELAQRQALERAVKRAPRVPTSDPLRQPPLHGANPHGQGGVAVVDTNPSNERPLGGAPSGSDSGEDAIVGRARGEKTTAGTYQGHITILALMGNELAGINTVQGETKNGPLQPIQTGVLDPLCTSTAQQVCLSVLTANSTTTATGSTNDFAVARASALGLGVGAAESQGTITEDANCQTAAGSAKTANVTAGAGAVAQAANSTSASRSCRGQAPQTANTSMVIGLGGVGVPLPAAGCADGTPDTVAGLPPLAPIVCNAEDVAGAAAVREALDVFVLNVGGTSLAKETTAASETFTVAPAGPETAGKPQCSDGMDNDGDGKIDALDPGCHTDGNANNPASFNPNDNDETDAARPAPPRDTTGAGDPDSGNPECSDNRDNDGDGRRDERDPGCHTDGNPNNPDSFDPDDDDEGDDGGGGPDDGSGAGGPSLDDGSLPFTGSDVVGLTLAGLLLLAGGLLLRRREGMSTGW